MTQSTNCYYVYIHRKSNTLEPFYIGKGKGRRAYKNTNRSNLWNYTKDKHGLVIEIYQDNLGEEAALSLEKELILQYGRVDIGTGCLVNFTDGGDTTNLSPIARKKISDASKGRVVSEEHKEFLRQKLTGRYIKNDYIYLGKITGERFEGTFTEVITYFGREKYSILRNLVAGRTRQMSGWYLNPSEELFKRVAEEKTKTPYQKFIFVNSEEDVVMTKAEFLSSTGVKYSPLFVADGKNRFVKGWAVVRGGETAEEVRAMLLQTGAPIYRYNSTTSEEFFIGTSREFSAHTGILLTNLFDLHRKQRGTGTVSGWFIAEKLN